MKSIYSILTNKKNLILFYFESLFFQVLILRICSQPSIFNLMNNIIRAINTIWVFFILLNDVLHKKIDIKDKKILSFCIFFVISTISWIFYQNSHNFYYVYDLVKLYAFGLIFYTYAHDCSQKDIKKFLNIVSYTFCTYIFIYNIISLGLYFTGNTYITLPNQVTYQAIGIDNALAHKPRYMGLWDWYTTASFHCYIALVLHLYLIDNGKNKVIHGLGILASAYMIYLTDSRSSLIILLFVLVCYFLLFIHKKLGTKKTIYIGLALFIVGLIGFVTLKVIKNPSLLSGNLHETLTELSSGRVQMAEGILSNLKYHFLLGEGYGNNTFVLDNYGVIHPHNAILAVILYSGILGLISYLIYVVFNIQSIIHNLHNIKKYKYTWLLIYVLCVVIESMFDICIIGARSTNIETPFFWLCLGIISYNTFKEDELI